MGPRVAVLGLWHETNTAAPHPTTLADFEQFELAAGDEIAEKNAGVGSVIGGFLDADGLDLALCFSAGAWPSGPVSSAARQHLIDRSLDELGRAGAVDGVLLNLHGAMVAVDDDDPELTLVREVRAQFPGAPIAGVLDLHANPSPELVELCDVLISYDTFPHVDMRERGREAASLLSAVLAGRVVLETTVAKVPLLACPLAQATDDEPMKGLQARARARAVASGLARVCVVGGFAYSDVARAGTSVLAVHDPVRRDAAREVLAATARDIEDHAPGFALRRDGVARAVARAVASSERPVVLVDVADNVGGGSPGDGTALLRELLGRGARNALVVIADPEAARAATALGAGATFSGLVGGKSDDRHGEPLELTGTVERTSDGRYAAEGSWMTGRSFEMGATVVLDVEGSTVVLTERRVPPFHAEQVTSLGIDPGAMDFIVAKGAIAWRAAFGHVARQVIEVATPGVCPVDPGAFDRTTVPMRFP